MNVYSKIMQTFLKTITTCLKQNASRSLNICFVGRLQSTQISLFKQFCNEESLISVHTIGNQVEYTYCSDISGVKSTFDHFVISNELSDCINKHCIIEDIENRSDHAPLCVDVTLPIIKSNIKDTRHFIPKPKWHAVTSTSLSHYKLTLV